MVENVTFIGANSSFAQMLILDVQKNVKSLKACDFNDKPSWFTTIEQNSSMEWLKLESANWETFLNAVKDTSCVVYLPHQSFNTMEAASLEEMNTLLLNTHYLSKACEHHKVEKIIYLSSMMPKDELKSSPLYLKFEIEQILKNSNAAVISVRAAPIVSTSIIPFKYILKMVSVFPIAFFPPWIEKQVQPVYWKDVVEILKQIYLDKSYTKITRNINLPGPELVSYRKVIEIVAKKKKLKRVLFVSNFIPEILTTFLLCLGLGKSIAQIRLWLRSWNQDAVALLSDWKQKRSWMGLDDAIKLSLAEVIEKTTVVIEKKEKTMVERVKNIGQLSSKELALEYFYWLQHFFQNLIRIEIKDNRVRIFFPQKLLLLLDLEVINEEKDNMAFKLIGGLMATKKSLSVLRFIISKNKNQIFGFIIVENFKSSWIKPFHKVHRRLHGWLSKRFQYYIGEN